MIEIREFMRSKHEINCLIFYSIQFYLNFSYLFGPCSILWNHFYRYHFCFYHFCRYRFCFYHFVCYRFCCYHFCWNHFCYHSCWNSCYHPFGLGLLQILFHVLRLWLFWLVYFHYFLNLIIFESSIQFSLTLCLNSSLDF